MRSPVAAVFRAAASPAAGSACACPTGRRGRAGSLALCPPSITGDLFGKKWATTNYGILDTAKGVASIFAGPVAALTSARTGTWVPVFWAMIGCDLAAAFLALPWLKPLAKAHRRYPDALRAEAGKTRGAAPGC